MKGVAKSALPLAAATAAIVAVWLPNAHAQDFTLTASSPTALYDPATGEAEFSVTVTLDEDVAAGFYPTEIYGFSLGLAHDGAVLAVLEFALGTGLQALNDGDGPDFCFSDLDPDDGADGIWVSAIMSGTGSEYLTCGEPTELLVFDYEAVPAALLGNESGTTTQLSWSSTLGEPDIETSITDDASEYFPALENGTVSLAPLGGGFLRGDADGSGVFASLLDAVFILNWQFNAGADPVCFDAADSDDNGAVQALVDALYLLAWAFSSGPPLPAPGPVVCGPDPTADALDCAAPPACN
ncbi:MAG: hypothetical protein L0Z55_07275 [Planctomycetes bacterium]|nr:hypothetical protein [Planctomycetota bacterium]